MYLQNNDRRMQNHFSFLEIEKGPADCDCSGTKLAHVSTKLADVTQLANDTSMH